MAKMNEKTVKNTAEIEKSEIAITTYMERSLHASLKEYFCADTSRHEVKIGKFVADACSDGVIYEIQTGSLAPLRKKIQFYLENTDFKVVVVHPIAQNRRIFWLDERSGELARTPRLSSKHENIASGLANLYYLREFLGKAELSFCFVMMEIDEVRLLDGYGKHKKIRATSVDRLAGEIYSLEYINSTKDARKIAFEMLPDGKFSREELGKSLKLSGRKLWSAQKLLTELGILSCEKDDRRFVFEKIVD